MKKIPGITLYNSSLLWQNLHRKKVNAAVRASLIPGSNSGGGIKITIDNPEETDMADNNAELAEILKLLKELKNDVTAVKAMLTDGGDITMQRDADGNFVSYKLKPHVNDNGVNGEDEPHGV